MSDVIDLDALQPQAAIIKFGGAEITLKPPKTGDILRLGQAAQKLSAISDQTAEEVNATVDEVTEQICKIIPELASQTLNTPQLMVLIKAISDMAVPPDAKELHERGITVDGSKKAE